MSLNALLANQSQATQLLNEAFDEYPDGTTLDSTGNWTNFSGTTLPFTVTSGTVTATEVASGVTGEDDRNGFTNTPVTTGLLYLSALVTPTFTTVPPANGDYFLSFYNQAATGGGYLARIFLSGTTNNTTTPGASFGLSNSGTAPIDSTTDVTSGTQYKLVLRLDFSTKIATLGVFLPSAAVTTDSQLTITDATAGTTATAGITSIAIRQGISSPAFSNVIDGIKVGTTLADVAGITTGASSYFNAIPEPSTYMLGLASLALMGYALRRRRNILPQQG